MLGFIFYLFFYFGPETEDVFEQIEKDETKTKTEKAKIIENIHTKFHVDAQQQRVYDSRNKRTIRKLA